MCSPSKEKQMIITKKVLEKSGYKSFPLAATNPSSNPSLGWSKVFYDSTNRKKYFIVFIEYNFPSYSMFSLNVRMYTEDHSFELNYIIEPGDTLQDVERFYEKVYVALNCVPDIHNND